MLRHVLFLGLACAAIQSASAQNWPKLPQYDRVITVEEVKEYWARKLPRPVKPRSLARGYKYKIQSYHQAVSRGRAQLRALKEGHHDESANLAALQNNRAYYLKQGDQQMADQLSRQIDRILDSRAARALARATREAQQAALNRAGEAEAAREAQRLQEEEEEEERRRQEEEYEAQQRAEEEERCRREAEEAAQRRCPTPPSQPLEIDSFPGR
jgi:hypothetical protein